MALPLFLMAAGVSAFGSIRGGVIAAQQGRIQEAEANILADITLQQQARDDQQLREAQQSRIGMIRASQGASGVDVASGSSIDFLLAQSRLDAITRGRRQFEGMLRARGLRFQGAQARFQGREAMLQGILSGAGAFVNAAALQQMAAAQKQGGRPGSSDVMPVTLPLGFPSLQPDIGQAIRPMGPRF